MDEDERLDRATRWLDKNQRGWDRTETDTPKSSRIATGVINPEKGSEFVRLLNRDIANTTRDASQAKAASNQPRFESEKWLGRSQREQRRDYSRGSLIGRTLSRGR